MPGRWLSRRIRLLQHYFYRSLQHWENSGLFEKITHHVWVICEVSFQFSFSVTFLTEWLVEKGQFVGWVNSVKRIFSITYFLIIHSDYFPMTLLFRARTLTPNVNVKGQNQWVLENTRFLYNRVLTLFHLAQTIKRKSWNHDTRCIVRWRQGTAAAHRVFMFSRIRTIARYVALFHYWRAFLAARAAQYLYWKFINSWLSFLSDWRRHTKLRF